MSVFRSRNVLLPGHDAPVAAALTVEAGRIVSIITGDVASAAVKGVISDTSLTGRGGVFDFGDAVIMPGVVDSHVHVNEPGRTEWEGFITATQAAAAGGITTLIDMPLNSIPATTSLAALEIKAKAAAGLCTIDYGFWGGVVPGNAAELQPMVEAGARGFKAFLVESGVEEFKMVGEADLRKAMPILAKLGVPLLVHAELECGGSAPCDADALDGGSSPHGDARSYSTYLASRPQRWEVEAIRLMIRLAAETSCRVHIVHLSAADALPEIARAKAAGTPITAETCPHYLTFTAETIAEGATHFKCAPPIRENSNRERLWKGLIDGTIDLVVSDHSPCTPVLKKLEAGDFAEAWGGIAGLQFSLPAVWTEARARGLGLARLAEWMCRAPARLAGLDGRKGSLAVGADADFVVWNPDASFTVERAMVRHRHSLTPYEGRVLDGVIYGTFVRGINVFEVKRAGERI